MQNCWVGEGVNVWRVDWAELRLSVAVNHDGVVVLSAVLFLLSSAYARRQSKTKRMPILSPVHSHRLFVIIRPAAVAFLRTNTLVECRSCDREVVSASLYFAPMRTQLSVLLPGSVNEYVNRLGRNGSLLCFRSGPPATTLACSGPWNEDEHR